MANYSGEKLFSISPNPAEGTSVKFVMNFSADENSTIVVYDNLGMMVGFCSGVQNERSIIFPSPLRSGMYYAKMVSKDFARVEKFVVR
jgi:hypothetical protein